MTTAEDRSGFSFDSSQRGKEFRTFDEEKTDNEEIEGLMNVLGRDDEGRGFS